MRIKSFKFMLTESWKNTGSLLCVGIDPDPSRFPDGYSNDPKSMLAFCRAIVDATAPFASTFKIQIAYFSAYRSESSVESLIDYIHTIYPGRPVILDSKRGDIKSTAKQYAREAFDRYDADAVTVNPYLGFDSIHPYIEYGDRGVIVLCRTSNPGSSDLQLLDVGGKPLYEILAEKAAKEWNASGQLSLVVGATFPEAITRVRARVGNMPLLIPGIGEQKGNLAEIIRAGKTPDGNGMMINSSRAILYSNRCKDFMEAAADEARATRNAINDAKFFKK